MTEVSSTDTTAVAKPGQPVPELGPCCLVMIYGPDLGRRITLQSGTIAVGRDEGNDVAISDPSVSREHCRLVVTEQSVLVRDLQSTNGTMLNDVGLAPHEDFRLAGGDLLCLGSVIFKFLVGGDVEALYHEEIHQTMIVDGLTRVHNRRYLDAFLEREISRSRRHGRPLAAMMIDVDHFKRVNDEYGHPAGDQVLRQIGAVLRRQIRREECAARFGGEEFVVVMPETERGGAIEFAERIVGQVELESFRIDDDVLAVTVSIGVAAWLPSMDARDLIAEADRCLYRAKAEGRNRVIG